jgi:hypothetical protein
VFQEVTRLYGYLKPRKRNLTDEQSPQYLFQAGILLSVSNTVFKAMLMPITFVSHKQAILDGLVKADHKTQSDL